MKLIVGLGNPGEKYKQNRHNVGFMFVDYLLTEFIKHKTCVTQPFNKDGYLQAEIATVHDTQSPSHDIVFVKSQTYMNKSGEVVAACVSRYPLQDIQTDLIVIHDDLDIPFGKFKIQMQGPKLHNGLTSIQNKLRTMDFLRIRIGVDNRIPENKISGEEFVLQNFTTEEQVQLPELFKKIEIRFKAFLQSENNCS